MTHKGLNMTKQYPHRLDCVVELGDQATAGVTQGGYPGVEQRQAGLVMAQDNLYITERFSLS